MYWFLLVCLACESGTDPSTSSSDTPTPPVEPPPDDTGSPEDAWWDQVTDADGDGALSDVDCDDTDPNAYPGASERCDGTDNDCNGEVDDGVLVDEEDLDLGDLSNTKEHLRSAYLFPDTDEDTTIFYVEDGNLDYFDIEAWVYQVPSNADYAVDLYWIEDASGAYRGLVSTADDAGLGGQEVVNYGGSSVDDDTGWYAVVVRSVHGSSCATPYQQQLLIGGW